MREEASDERDLVSTLSALEPLLNTSRRAIAVSLRARMMANQFRVLVVGEAKRGKSTFVNALVGRDVLPTGVVPVTALVTTLVAGAPETVSVVGGDGRQADYPLELLADFVTEAGNPGNRRDVASVTVTLDASLLRGGVQLVDTPGVGSVLAQNTRAAKDGLDDVDAAILVLSADPPISASELELLRFVRQRAQFVLFALNKIDYLSPDDALRVHEFTARTLRKATGEAVELYDCSASRGLTARLTGDAEGVGAAGIAVFERVLVERVAAVRDDALPASIAAHAMRLVEAQLDDAELELRVTRLRATGEARQLAEFRQSLDVAIARQEELRTLIDARRRFLLEKLVDANDRLRRRLWREVVADVNEFINADAQWATKPRELEIAGHARATVLIRGAIDAWLDEQGAKMQAEFVTLTESIASDLTATVDGLRDAGRLFLDVDLRLAHDPPRVPPSTRFQFDFTEDAGPTELLAGALRRRLPGKVGRRHAVRWLDRDLRDQVDRHVGRARADVSERLATACRELVGTATSELDSIVVALRDVLDRAAHGAADVAERDSAEQAPLEGVVDGLRALRGRLASDHRAAFAPRTAEREPWPPSNDRVG